MVWFGCSTLGTSLELSTLEGVVTRKDYQKIVNALAKAACDNAGRGGVITVMDDISFVAGAEQAVIRLALALSDDNPRFDKSEFYRAFDLAVSARRRFLANNEVA